MKLLFALLDKIKIYLCTLFICLTNFCIWFYLLYLEIPKLTVENMAE